MCNDCKPACPYCGAEMEPRNISHYYYTCPICYACSPVHSEYKSARAAAMQRYQEPNRALTLEELMDFCDTHAYIEPIYLVGKGAISVGTGWAWAGAVNAELLQLEQYIKGYPDEWEAYLHKPTEDESKNAPWVL